MDFLVELCLDVSALDLQVLQGVDASLHNLGQTEIQDKLPSTPGNTDACSATMRLLVASQLPEFAKPPEENVLAGFAGASRGPRFPQQLINQLGAPEPSGAVPQGRSKVRAAQHVHVANILKHQGWAAPFYSTFFFD